MTSTGGLRWALIEYLSKQDLMKDAWVVLQSLRQGGAQVFRVLRDWVEHVIRHEDNDGDDLEPWYSQVGVDDRWMPLFVQLQIRWEDGVLKVSVRFEFDPGGLRPVLTALMYLWRFPR